MTRDEPNTPQHTLTDKRVSKYEHAQVIGVRTEMLARGSPPLVHLHDGLKSKGHYDIKLIAEEELRQGALPFDILRQSVSKTGTVIAVPLYHNNDQFNQ